VESCRLLLAIATNVEEIVEEVDERREVVGHPGRVEAVGGRYLPADAGQQETNVAALRGGPWSRTNGYIVLNPAKYFCHQERSYAIGRCF